ncbi:energy transducer TonB [Chryseobacterium sp.]|uniref:energy transducer TonB n=1 Tax=Chryseobacterium sp. TaxID=1871047 RepID=UPI0025B98CF6|nr:energy transducer TonB [Chryseobacterium sp.]
MRQLLLLILFLSTPIYGQQAADTIQKGINSNTYKAETPPIPPEGGIEVYKEKICRNISHDRIIEKGKMFCIASFVVEKDGSISNIKTEGVSPSFNQEVMKAIKQTKEKWIPATSNGTNIRRQFYIPFSIKN